MALQQAQLLLNMSSLEPVNFGVQQNNTEAFAVALCHLAELHAEQVRSYPPLPGEEGQVTSGPQMHPSGPFVLLCCCRPCTAPPRRSCST